MVFAINAKVDAFQQFVTKAKAFKETETHKNHTGGWNHTGAATPTGTNATAFNLTTATIPRASTAVIDNGDVDEDDNIEPVMRRYGRGAVRRWW